MFLQRERVLIWLYENVNMKMEGIIVVSAVAVIYCGA